MPSIHKLLVTPMLLLLLLFGCLACASSVASPTPTAIPLSTQQAPTRVTAAGREATLASSPMPAMEKTATATSVTAAEGTPTVAGATPAVRSSGRVDGHAVSTTPTPVRIMALGRQVSVSVHSLPDSSAPVEAVLAGSDVLWARARTADGRWVQVVFGEEERQAWAATADLALLGEAESLPVAAAEAVAGSTEVPETNSVRLQGRVVADPLNVRDAPGLGGRVLGQLQADDPVSAVGRSDDADWLAIAREDGPAWVAAEYVALDGTASDLPVIAVEIKTSLSSAPALGGKLAFQTRTGGDIWLVNADGSDLRQVAEGLDPALSPDGIRLAYARWGSPHAIYVLDLRSGEEERIAQANRPRSPTWSPDGDAVAFSHLTGSYTCRVTPFGCIDEEVLRDFLGGEECIDTPQGRFCLSDFPADERDLTGLAQANIADKSWHDLPAEEIAQSPCYHPLWNLILYDGRTGLQLTEPSGDTRPLSDLPDAGSPAWAPDGQGIVVQRHQHDHTDLFLLDSAGNVIRQLTSPPSGERAPNNVAPAWSPDGQYIVFLSDRSGEWRLYRMTADGSNQILFLPSTLADIEFQYDFAAERVVDWGS